MSVLGNQTAVNAFVDFYVSAGETGATGDDLFIVPDVSGAATVVVGNLDTITSFNLPLNKYSPDDNFLFNATVELTSISYSTPPTSKTINLYAVFVTGGTTYAVVRPVYLTSSLTAVSVTLPTLVANTGQGTAVEITLRNDLTEDISFNYNITDISFVRANSGGVASF